MATPWSPPLEAEVLAPAEEVLLGDLGHQHGAVLAAVACADREQARGALLDADIDVRQVLLGPFGGLKIHFLEVTEPAEPGVAALQLVAVVEFPFREGQLPADDLVACLRVAGDVDPVEVDEVSFLDVVGDVDLLLGLFRLGLGVDLGIGIAVVVRHPRQIIEVF